MKKQSLGGVWDLTFADVRCSGTIPGSVYSFLLEAGLMEDPFYRENELAALALMENDFTFTRCFTPQENIAESGRILLRCEGLDTLCSVHLNNKQVGFADNMHRCWEFDVTPYLIQGENRLEIKLKSPTKYIREADHEDHVGGMTDAMQGFPHLRKAHCMFGWDWGPRLPDAGIWRDISLMFDCSNRIEDIYVRQIHESGKVYVSATVRHSGAGEVTVSCLSPDGIKMLLENGKTMEVPNPRLWWPRGLGEQPLYTVEAVLSQNGTEVDRVTRRIGLRTMTVERKKDEWGESFAQCCNGVSFFAMGADYIPEDNILSRITPQRTRVLLEQCTAAHFNSIRVWGGGYYPDDWFFDICDELGLVVWQDFMFACANYRLTPEFEANIRAECKDNIRRIRHHACLGLWCGNNEMEMFQAISEYDGTPKTRSDYIRMFEHMIPEILREEDPDTFYWPASPSSGGGFDKPNDPNSGDVHYWDVWHGMKPFTDYRNYFFRYVSEFGFQSFPSLPTIESFTLPEDRNIFSRVMERHQRNGIANGRIMNYLSQTYLYPTSFELLIYASQLLQAQAIRYGVEHWRRNRGRCMGAIYWQLNDCWQVASWSSLDWFGRWKALHYYAKRFFAPVMVSCEETGEFGGRLSINDEAPPPVCKARLNIANETRDPVRGILRWRICDPYGAVVEEKSYETTVPPLSCLWGETLEFAGLDCLSRYISFSFTPETGEPTNGTALFTSPKHFKWADPTLNCERRGNAVTVRSAAFAKDVEVYSPDEPDLLLDDNYFDIDSGEKTVRILRGNPKTLLARSVYDIR